MSFFKSFEGWKDQGRKGHPILLAHFTKADGGKARYNVAALEKMGTNPPPSFAETDRKMLAAVMGLRNGPA